MARAVATRGVIEGFYGPPWGWATRRRVLAFLAERGMNAYVYAPKDDPFHRQAWRTPYPAEDRAEFAGLAQACRGMGVSFGFALSPGLDLDFGSAADRAALLDKLLAALEDGADWLVLAFDDLPGAADHVAGAAQALLVAWAADQVWARAPDVRLSVVPTQYVGSVASPYLAALGDGLPRPVDVMWTGQSVVCGTITAEQARARANALDGRPPLLWDNYPVNDGLMARSLFLGPYEGRDPGLADEVAGVLCNPMPQAWASCVALATAAEFLVDPARYDPAAAWERALSDVGGASGGAVLRVLAEACADSPLRAPSATRLHRLIDAEAWDDAAELLQAAAAARPPAAAAAGSGHGATPGDGSTGAQNVDADGLWAEVEPWLRQLRADARAGLAALELLDAVRGGVPDDIAARSWALLFLWERARAGGLHVFGPRFAVYPVAGAGPDGNWAVDLAQSVVEDQSAIDRLCRLAAAAAHPR